MKTKTWALVANRSQARVMQWLEEPASAWRDVACFTHPEGRLQGREVETGPPPRTVESDGRRAAIEPREDRETVEAKAFARQLCEFLTHAGHTGEFSQLVLVAPPKVLGLLRDLLPQPVHALVSLELDKDVAMLPVPQLDEWLQEAAPMHAK